MKSKTKKVYYAVRRGRNTGVFSSWKDCQKQVQKFARAEFQKFTTEQAALVWLGAANSESAAARAEMNDFDLDIYTDGSLFTGGAHGYEIKMGYGAWYKSYDKEYALAMCATKELLRKEFGSTVANAPPSSSLMEMCGAIHALRALRGRKCGITIHADNEGVRNWYSGSWKAKKPHIIELLKQFREEVNYFDFVRVEPVDAHTGNEGNEAADTLAKEGALNTRSTDGTFKYYKSY